jgi:hypothetical protein
MAETFLPPSAVRAAAARGLALRAKHNRGGTAVGLGRGRQLVAGKSVDLKTIKEMYAYFERHAVDKQGKDWNNAANPSAGKIAWLLWGGEPGWTWATGIRNRAMRSED